MSEQPNSDNSRQDALRTARKQITRSLLLSLAALGVIVIACYAWFVRNTTVSGALGSISAGTGNFELASVGSTLSTDPARPTEWYVDEGDNWTGPNSQPGTIASDRKSAILWQVNEYSNLGNYQCNGIQPGSSGKLEFYVVPKRDGTLALTFQVELIPQASQGASTEIINDLLRGHLLFSFVCTAAKDSTSTPTWIDCQSREFSLTFENVDSPILVTLNWQWPYVLEDVVGDDTILNRMKAHPSFFFYNRGTVSSAEDLSENLQTYSDYYNNADQYIGDHVTGLLLRMTAVEG